MFSSHVLRRSIEKKALFLQCHTHFHAVAIRDIQSMLHIDRYINELRVH